MVREPCRDQDDGERDGRVPKRRHGLGFAGCVRVGEAGVLVVRGLEAVDEAGEVLLAGRAELAGVGLVAVVLGERAARERRANRSALHPDRRSLSPPPPPAVILAISPCLGSRKWARSCKRTSWLPTETISGLSLVILPYSAGSRNGEGGPGERVSPGLDFLLTLPGRFLRFQNCSFRPS